MLRKVKFYKHTFLSALSFNVFSFTLLHNYTNDNIYYVLYSYHNVRQLIQYTVCVSKCLYVFFFVDPLCENERVLNHQQTYRVDQKPSSYCIINKSYLKKCPRS